MTWLIRLYPPAWRRRYGRELAELLAAQPTSFRTAVDLVAGAVDAWLNPYLKGYPARVQAVLIGGPAVIVIAIALGGAWINNN